MTGTYREKGIVHGCFLFFAAHPSLRSPGFGVVAVQRHLTMHCPWALGHQMNYQRNPGFKDLNEEVERKKKTQAEGSRFLYHPDSCAWGYGIAIDLDSIRGYHTLKREGERGMQPAGFVHAGFQVRQGLRLPPAYVSGDATLSRGVVDLFSDFGERGRVLEEVIHDGAGQYAGRVCACHDVRIDPCGDEPVYASVSYARSSTNGQVFEERGIYISGSVSSLAFSFMKHERKSFWLIFRFSSSVRLIRSMIRAAPNSASGFLLDETGTRGLSRHK